MKSCGWSHASLWGYSWWCTIENGHDGPDALWRIWDLRRFFKP